MLVLPGFDTSYHVHGLNGLNTYPRTPTPSLSLSSSSPSTMWKSIRKHFKLPKKLTKKLTKKEVPNKDIPDEHVPDEQVPGKEVPDEEVPREEVTNEEVPDEQVPNEEVPGNEVPDEQVPDEESSDEQVPGKDRFTRRFRVLILGPANAGKTTLLERLTDSPAGAAIVTRNGKRVSTAVVRPE
jgi:hypothetical protein